MQIEGVKNVENLEQRQKELIEVQSQMEAYEERLESYVVVSRRDSTIYNYLREYYKTDFKTFLNWANSYNYLLFTENEAYIYQSLDFQIQGATLNLPELNQNVTDAYNVLEEARTKHPNEPNHADIQAAQRHMMRRLLIAIC